MVEDRYKLGRKQYMKEWYSSTNAHSQTKEYKRQSSLDWDRKNPEKYLLRGARNRAKRDGKDFNITVDDIYIPELCPVLGIRLTGVREGVRPKDSTPSLDRRDNSLGYVKGNVFVISWRANQLKSNMSIDEMKGLLNYALSTPSN